MTKVKSGGAISRGALPLLCGNGIDILPACDARAEGRVCSLDDGENDIILICTKKLLRRDRLPLAAQVIHWLGLS